MHTSVFNNWHPPWDELSDLVYRSFCEIKSLYEGNDYGKINEKPERTSKKLQVWSMLERHPDRILFHSRWFDNLHGMRHWICASIEKSTGTDHADHRLHKHRLRRIILTHGSPRWWAGLTDYQLNRPFFYAAVFSIFGFHSPSSATCPSHSWSNSLDTSRKTQYVLLYLYVFPDNGAHHV